MQVKDLIARLSKLPQNQEILIWDGWNSEYKRFKICDGTSYNFGDCITDSPGYLDDAGLKTLKVKIENCVVLEPKYTPNDKLKGLR